jgi:hypothetical protein
MLLLLMLLLLMLLLLMLLLLMLLLLMLLLLMLLLLMLLLLMLLFLQLLLWQLPARLLRLTLFQLLEKMLLLGKGEWEERPFFLLSRLHVSFSPSLSSSRFRGDSGEWWVHCQRKVLLLGSYSKS